MDTPGCGLSLGVLLFIPYPGGMLRNTRREVVSTIPLFGEHILLCALLTLCRYEHRAGVDLTADLGTLPPCGRLTVASLPSGGRPRR